VIVTPDALLFRIRAQADQVIGNVRDAMQYPLTTEDDPKDSPEAREKLTQAERAAKVLAAHLDKFFEFSNGSAERKQEEPCPESSCK
jgi:hypothetical protein